MNLGLEFQAIWNDVNMTDVQISVWNGAFGGMSCADVAIGELEKAAATLRGFPNNPPDTRELTFHGLGKGRARGDVRLRFYSTGGAVHAWMDASVESACDLTGSAQSVPLTLAIEAAAIDVFVDQLHRLGATRTGVAQLNGVVRG